MKRIVIFASGSGTNAENLIKFFHNSDNASVIQVLTNNPHAKVLDRAKKLKVSALSFNRIAFSKTDDVLNLLKTSQPDLIVLGHADLISPDMLGLLKDEYPYLRIAQWFLDPLNKNGPDYFKNKKRILDKSEFVDSNFITTSPDVLSFLPKKVQNYSSTLFY